MKHLLRPTRRRLLIAAGAWELAARIPAVVARDADRSDHWPAVQAGRALRFPRDHGAHPPYRTEWWYLTGWLSRAGGEPVGVQITFFRSRTGHASSDPSRFAPTQLLFAHAALASPDLGHLIVAERSARPGFGLAGFSDEDLDVHIGDWRLQRDSSGRIDASIADPALALALKLSFTPAGPPIAQGQAGYSRKGPQAAQASWYYSQPQLAVSGSVRVPGSSATTAVSGKAWLDHEWSSEILDPQAVGWDWVGLNFDDGSALMAFRIRRRDGGVLWSDAKFIDAAQIAGHAIDARSAASSDARPDGGLPTVGKPVFTPRRIWQSPRTGARWPVAMRLQLDARTLDLEPLFDDQEIDASASTGTVYWEGAVRVLESGRQVGAGYLELTGYAGAVRL